MKLPTDKAVFGVVITGTAKRFSAGGGLTPALACDLTRHGGFGTIQPSAMDRQFLARNLFEPQQRLQH